MSMNNSNRIIVVGAGPVGLCLTLALTQAGLSVTLLESRTDENFLDQVPRAGTNHPATLEMYERIGLYKRVESRGMIAPIVHYWERQGPELIAEFDHALLKEDTSFPYVVQCERIKVVEEALAMAKDDPNCDLRMGTTFESFEQKSDGVVAVVTNADGEQERISGRFLVSAEGARSLIRNQLGIEFEGFTYPDRTLNIEVAYDFSRHGYADRNYISDPEEWSNLFQWPGPPKRWRVHFPTPPDADPETLLAPEALQKKLQAFMQTDQEFDIHGSNLYTVHQRVAKTFRMGNVLLAGDAAHVNSPIGGMGMNSGIHDAFNLADKLIGIERGEMDTAVLDRYDRQRRTIAVEHTQAQTIRNKKLLMEKDPAVRRQNQDQLRKTAADPKLARDFMLRASLINSVRQAEQIE
jgi:3-(3-hydroxy-phenyl)propionate hydroxylase